MNGVSKEIHRRKFQNRIKTRPSNIRSANVALISQLEPKKINEALEDESKVKPIDEELEQFDKNRVWTLVPKLDTSLII